MKSFRAYVASAFLVVAVAVGGWFAPAVVAQNAGQTLTNLLSTDLIQIYRAGTAAITYASPAQISNVSGYTKLVPDSLFNYTFGNGQTDMLFRPAGTLAFGYVTLAASPSDGARQCVFTTQQITTLYLTANAGQAINNAVSTLAANARACYIYSLSNTTWDRAQ